MQRAITLVLALLLSACTVSPYDVEWTVSDESLVEPVRLAWQSITGEDYIPRVTDERGEYHIRYAGTEHIVYSEHGVHKLCRGVRGVHSRAENTITICEGERGSDYLQRIVTHELLHSFGLGHEHGDTESVMNDNGRFRHVEFPTEHDYAQLDALK